jgi:hypothetical protein
MANPPAASLNWEWISLHYLKAEVVAFDRNQRSDWAGFGGRFRLESVVALGWITHPPRLR